MPALDYAAARSSMVTGQLKPNRITDSRLLAAMSELPREDFVPPALAGVAYVDEDLEIPGGGHLLAPMTMARLIQALAPKSGDSALEVGTATGYGAAILSRLTDFVVAVESREALVAGVQDAVSRVGADNVVIVSGPAAQGWMAHAPYNIILVNGAAAEVPSSLIDQLAVGGRLAYIHRQKGAAGRLRLVEKLPSGVSARDLSDISAPFVPGLEPKPGFVF